MFPVLQMTLHARKAEKRIFTNVEKRFFPKESNVKKTNNFRLFQERNLTEVALFITLIIE